MAARTQADPDIEPSRGLRNKMTQRAGEHFVAAEVNRRGAIATASGDVPGIESSPSKARDPARSISR